MKSKKKDQTHLPPGHNHNLHLSDVVALLENKSFIADSREYWDHYRAHSQRIGQDREVWDREAPEFMEKFLDPFTQKWGGVYPAHDALLSSPLWQEKNTAVTTGKWGVIPVFPWTTREEVASQLGQIQAKIGKSHKDYFISIRLAQIAHWLQDFFISTRTGKSPKLGAIAQAVWGRTKGLRRSTPAAAIASLSEEEEHRLLTRYKAKGKTPKEAERLVYRAIRGSEAPAPAMVRIALRRLKQRNARGKEMIDPQNANDLGLAITRLLQVLPTSASQTPDLAAIRSRAVDLGNLLLPPEPQP